MYSGMPLGTTISGLAAAWLIPHFGWQSMFVVGGIVPIIIAAVIVAFLPESLEFLTLRNRDEARIRTIVRRISPALADDPQVVFRPTDKKLPGVPVKNLFTEKRAIATVLFWITLAAAYYFANILVYWVPTLLHKVGATVVQYSLTFAAFNLGAGAGMILAGGYLLTMGWTVSRICSTNSVVGLFCAVLVLVLGGRVAANARYQEGRTLEASEAV